MKLLTIARRRKGLSENCQSVEGAREERASSPPPSPPEQERERISQTRSKEERKHNDSKFKNVTGQSRQAERRAPALRGPDLSLSRRAGALRSAISDPLLKNVSHPLLAASIIVYAGINLTRADDNPPAAKPAQIKSQLTASDVQPGLANDWLRGQFNSFSNWDLGGQFRARYEHAEYLGTVDFSAMGG